MPKAYILNEHLNDADRAVIDTVLQTAGYEPTYAVPADTSIVDAEADIGVVCLPTAPEDEAVINARMQAFAGAGIRVVCIWLHDEESEGTGVPAGVGKYGTIVDIGSDELVGTLKGETNVWQESGGASSPPPVTKRNKC